MAVPIEKSPLAHTARRPRVAALLNPAAGAAADARIAAASEALAAAGVDAEIIAARGAGIDAALRAAVDSAVDAVVVGGGDGTIRAAAAALRDTGVPLGILPLGTFNHFAKDLGIPLTLEDAARTIAAGVVRRIDVASVNGAVFVNNSSIGLYPQVVRDREEQRARLGRGKWPAFALATIAALRRFPMVEVHCDVESRSFRRVTPFTFVGNNRYQLNGLALGGRASLADGQLCLHLVNRPNRFGLFRLALRALLGRLQTEREIESVFATELSIATRRRWVHVSTDGELAVMKSPLLYRIHPAALSVIVPASDADWASLEARR